MKVFSAKWSLSLIFLPWKFPTVRYAFAYVTNTWNGNATGQYIMFSLYIYSTKYVAHVPIHSEGVTWFCQNVSSLFEQVHGLYGVGCTIDWISKRQCESMPVNTVWTYLCNQLSSLMQWTWINISWKTEVRETSIFLKWSCTSPVSHYFIVLQEPLNFVCLPPFRAPSLSKTPNPEKLS